MVWEDFRIGGLLLVFFIIFFLIFLKFFLINFFKNFLFFISLSLSKKEARRCVR